MKKVSVITCSSCGEDTFDDGLICFNCCESLNKLLRKEVEIADITSETIRKDCVHGLLTCVVCCWYGGLPIEVVHLTPSHKGI